MKLKKDICMMRGHYFFGPVQLQLSYSFCDHDLSISIQLKSVFIYIAPINIRHYLMTILAFRAQPNKHYLLIVEHQSAANLKL